MTPTPSCHRRCLVAVQNPAARRVRVGRPETSIVRFAPVQRNRCPFAPVVDARRASIWGGTSSPGFSGVASTAHPLEMHVAISAGFVRFPAARDCAAHVSTSCSYLRDPLPRTPWGPWTGFAAPPNEHSLLGRWASCLSRPDNDLFDERRDDYMPSRPGEITPLAAKHLRMADILRYSTLTPIAH